MTNYQLIEEKLNEKSKAILLLIKQDYYNQMSDDIRQRLDDLIRCDRVVIVNSGKSVFGDDTVAHGGRTLGDGKIHFYPDVRESRTEDETIEEFAKLLPHECFHYFIQPDELAFDSELEKEMARFYTEGAVEKEAREFCNRHRREIAFEKANYGFNINFANIVQNRLGLANPEDIFSSSGYLKHIGNYAKEYKRILEMLEKLMTATDSISIEFPNNLQKKVRNRMKTMILQDGNANAVREKLESFEFIAQKSISRLNLDNSDEKEFDD